MGLSKARLPFGPETMLQRVVRLLHTVVQPITVVTAPLQKLPDLTPKVLFARDEQEGLGPLEGLRAGLAVLQDHAEAAFAVGCDVPLLVPGLVSRLTDLLEHHDVVVTVQGEIHHPLVAVYRTSVLPKIEELLGENRFRPVFLYEHVDTRCVSVDELRDVDPQLQSLTNLNRPEDYLAALAQAGLSPDSETLRCLQR